jgi:hypothetical protein
MSMQQPLSAFPSGVSIGTYPTYAKAQEAVDYLSDNQFPVQNVTIVGTDLRMIEQVTGRLTRGAVVRTAATTGGIWGLFIGAVVSLFGGNATSFLIVGLVTLLIGAGFGALTGYMAYAATGGKRDFTSRSGVVATSYEVLCEARVAEDARNLLGRLALRDG